MKVLGKMENVKLLSVRVDFSISYRTYNGYEFRGVAKYRIGWKTYKCEFMCLENAPYKIAYLDNNYRNYRIPSNRLQNEALLVLIYGEIAKYLGRMEQIEFFKERRKQEEEERRQKEEEEKAKRIELGEQVSIEKYLKNL